MNKHTDKWKDYITENHEEYQIFCDLDGVLVNLISGVNDAIYNEPPEDSSPRYKKAQQKAREALGGKTLTEQDADKKSDQFKKPVR